MRSTERWRIKFNASTASEQVATNSKDCTLEMYFLSTSSAGGSSSTAKQLIFFSGIGKSFVCFNYFVFCKNIFLKQYLHIYRKHIFRLTNIQLVLTWIKKLQSLFYIF